MSPNAWSFAVQRLRETAHTAAALLAGVSDSDLQLLFGIIQDYTDVVAAMGGAIDMETINMLCENLAKVQRIMRVYHAKVVGSLSDQLIDGQVRQVSLQDCDTLDRVIKATLDILYALEYAITWAQFFRWLAIEAVLPVEREPEAETPHEAFLRELPSDVSTDPGPDSAPTPVLTWPFRRP
jgi:hypothetical protein